MIEVSTKRGFCFPRSQVLIDIDDSERSAHIRRGWASERRVRLPYRLACWMFDHPSLFGVW
jgi:hypothetical protein